MMRPHEWFLHTIRVMFSVHGCTADCQGCSAKREGSEDYRSPAALVMPCAHQAAPVERKDRLLCHVDAAPVIWCEDAQRIILKPLELRIDHRKRC